MRNGSQKSDSVLSVALGRIRRRGYGCQGLGVSAFPNDEAIFKLLWLGLREASKKWKRPIRDWKAALNQFVILYGDRVPIEQ